MPCYVSQDDEQTFRRKLLCQYSAKRGQEYAVPLSVTLLLLLQLALQPLWVLACSTIVEYTQQEGFYRVPLPAARQTPQLGEPFHNTAILKSWFTKTLRVVKLEHKFYYYYALSLSLSLYIYIYNLRRHCHNSKFVIFQEKLLKVLKCYHFL